jgi:ketosteroid isomerase-like protein
LRLSAAGRAAGDGIPAAHPDATEGRMDMDSPEGVRDAYMSAVLSQDPEKAIGTYAVDVCRFPSGPRWFVHGLLEVREEWSEWLREPPARYRAFRWIDGPYGEARGELAWIAGVLEQDYVWNGAAASRHIRVSMVLCKNADGWRIALEHNSRPDVEPYQPNERRYPVDSVPEKRPTVGSADRGTGTTTGSTY